MRPPALIGAAFALALNSTAAARTAPAAAFGASETAAAALYGAKGRSVS